MNRLGVCLTVSLVLCAACIARLSQAQGHPAYHGGPAASGRDANVEKLSAEAAKLEAQVRAKPKDAKLKQRAADAEYRAGHASMMSPTLDRKVKYREALRAFRRALSLNPRHKEASQEMGMIESIYKQMGRPIPN